MAKSQQALFKSLRDFFVMGKYGLACFTPVPFRNDHDQESAAQDSADRTANRNAQSPYICPMCEGVESDSPGDCPQCGMALERNPAAKRRRAYTCPMHPEVRQEEPGQCPKCGMDLEPETPTRGDGNPEYDFMRRRFWVAVALAVPVFVLAMGGMV